MTRQSDVLQTIQPILATMAEAALAFTGGVSSQVWLMGPGDLCEECPRRDSCPERSACLHLAGGAGASGQGPATTSRLPLGTSPVGRLPRTGGTLLARSDLPEQAAADATWLRRSGVKAIAGLPLEHGRRPLGVLVVFTRSKPSEEQLLALAGAARLGAEAIGNVEAYRSLAVERNRLAAKNARLRAGLGLPEEAEQAPTVTPSPPAPASRPPAAGTAAEAGAAPEAERFVLPPLRSFAQIQREGILHALERTGWRVSGPRGAAAALGLRPTTLESKMKRLGIRRPPR